MNETQHFCLRWNNYQSSITSAFENLRDDEDFVDVTLACEGRSIKAHRVVLSACSPYFRDLLKSTPCKHPVILLQDVNYMDLLSLVEFIYHGEVNVHQKSLQSFLKTAEVLRVSGLTQQQAEETHSQLAHIQNLAAGGGTPASTPQHMLHDDLPLYGRSRDGNGIGGGASSPPPPTSAASHLAQQITQLPMYRKTSYRRHERNSLTPSAAEDAAAMKRARGDNGLMSAVVAAGAAIQNNSPDLLHQRSASPQMTPADFSTIKHNNNNTPPPQSQLKDEKPYFPGSNGNGQSTGNGPPTGNGLSVSDKIASLTPSPMSRSMDDVKTEPMELVCGGGNAAAGGGAGSASGNGNNNNNSNNNNNNNNVTTIDENSNDSTGDHDANRSSCGEGGAGGVVGVGKGSMSSGNDDEIENNMPQHPPPPYLMSPADTKLFGQTPFNFAMSNLDASTLAGLNSQFSQSAAEMAVSPQGSHIIRSAATSPTSSTSAPPSPPTALTSPNSSLSSLAGIGAAAAIYNSMHNSPPRPGSGPNENGHIVHNLNNLSNLNNNNNNSHNSSSNNNNSSSNNNNNGSQPQMPLRMPPPTSGGINEPQECPYCRRTFSCYYSLKRHFQDKHEQSDTLYVCEFCHRRYRTKNSLTTHKSLQHRGSSGMLKRLLKTSAIKNVLVPHPHSHHAHHAAHHHALTHAGRASLFDFTSELGPPPPGIQ